MAQKKFLVTGATGTRAVTRSSSWWSEDMRPPSDDAGGVYQ